MDEIRAKKLEIDVFHLHKRADDCDAKHVRTSEQLLAVDRRVDVLTENTLAVVHLTETINSLVEALGFLRKIAQGFLAIGAAIAAVWVGIKYAWNHL